MAKIQKNFIKGKMNKGVDERLVPQGEYVDALNIRLGSTEGTEIGAVENSKGNELLVELSFGGQPLSSNARCIGAFEDGGNETIYWFINDPTNLISAVTGKVDLIVSFNVRLGSVFYHVTSTSVLNFDSKYLINGVNLIDGLLFFTDNLNPPRKINVNRTYLPPISGVDSIIEQDISVILAPPLNSPTIEQFNLGGDENYMEELFLSFAYRWQYQDGEYSAISPFSQTAFSPGPFELNYSTFDNSAMVNSFNSVKITFETGGRNVIAVDVLFKFSTSQNVNVIERFKKIEEGWSDNVPQNITFTNQKIFTALNHSPMGYSIAASIGASLAEPKKKIIVIIGDGSVPMNVQELENIKNLNLPIYIFIINNSGYGMIKQTLNTWLKGNYVGCDKKSGLSLPNNLKRPY